MDRGGRLEDFSNTLALSFRMAEIREQRVQRHGQN
jgi:hypothetical protein